MEDASKNKNKQTNKIKNDQNPNRQTNKQTLTASGLFNSSDTDDKGFSFKPVHVDNTLNMLGGAVYGCSILMEKHSPPPFLFSLFFNFLLW